MGVAVDIPKRASCLGMGDPIFPIHPHTAHPRHIDHHRPVAHRETRNVVTATFDAEFYVTLTRKIHARHHIGDTDTTSDDRGSPIDHSVPDRAGVIISGITLDN